MSSTNRRPSEGAPLSPAEVELMRDICNGSCASAAAKRKGLTRHASASHVRNILAKLGASTQAQAAYIVAQRGLLDIQGPPKPPKALLRSLAPSRPRLPGYERVIARVRAVNVRAQITAPNSVFALGQMLA